MNTNRRKFIGAIGATGLAGSFAAAKVNAQDDKQSPPISAAADNSNRELSGKVAIVTGARANFGRAFAEVLAKNGADVVVHYHREETRDQAEETASLIEAQGSRAVLVQGDLGQIDTVMQMFDAATENLGQLDIVINNAGAIVKKPMAEVTDEDLERMININTRGTYYCMREASRRIADNGRIINIGTSLLSGMAPNYSAYAGTKSIMEEVTRAGARELGERGITVNTISPGPFDTPFFHSQETPESTEFASNLSVVGRLGQIGDLVPLVEFLASPGSQWINGQTIWINGGYLTR
ncbi:MAG: SDR family oxidoreductase [Cyanobacteria bacterium P01_A01_bin.40]